MRLWPVLTAAFLSVVGLPNSARAICSSPTLCWVDQAGNRLCRTFNNVCKAVRPRVPSPGTYSIELKDLTKEDVQKISDLLGLEIDASKLDTGK
jgi:hypothetical protein